MEEAHSRCFPFKANPELFYHTAGGKASPFKNPFTLYE